MVHGGTSFHTKETTLNHNACKAKIDKLWKETSGTSPGAAGAPGASTGRPIR